MERDNGLGGGPSCTRGGQGHGDRAGRELGVSWEAASARSTLPIIIFFTLGLQSQKHFGACGVKVGRGEQRSAPGLLGGSGCAGKGRALHRAGQCWEESLCKRGQLLGSAGKWGARGQRDRGQGMGTVLGVPRPWCRSSCARPRHQSGWGCLLGEVSVSGVESFPINQ